MGKVQRAPLPMKAWVSDECFEVKNTAHWRIIRASSMLDPNKLTLTQVICSVLDRGMTDKVYCSVQTRDLLKGLSVQCKDFSLT